LGLALGFGVVSLSWDLGFAFGNGIEIRCWGLALVARKPMTMHVGLERNLFTIEGTFVYHTIVTFLYAMFVSHGVPWTRGSLLPVDI
jgi:hypothetical protein